MSKYVIDEGTLRDIADAIRAKKKSESPIKADDFAALITEIENGGTDFLIQLLARNGEEIKIPSGIKRIGSYAFYQYQALKKIIISEGVESIGEQAFGMCKGVEEYRLPNSLKSIEKGAFRNNVALKALKHGSGIERFGDQVFWQVENCRTHDFSDSIAVPTLGNDVFYKVNDDNVFIVPEALYEAWLSDTTWADWKNYIYTRTYVPRNTSLPVETVWQSGGGCYIYSETELNVFYKKDSETAVQLVPGEAVFGGMQVYKMFDGEYGCALSGTLTFSAPGRYKFWVQDGSGNRFCGRIVEVQ